MNYEHRTGRNSYLTNLTKKIPTFLSEVRDLLTLTVISGMAQTPSIVGTISPFLSKSLSQSTSVE